MVQKMGFLLEEIGALMEPTMDELEQYYTKNITKYAVSREVSFIHVYLSPARHGENLALEISRLKDKLSSTSPTESLRLEMGNSLMLPFQIVDTALDQIGRMFGSEFAEQLKNLELHKWSEPIQSSCGLHFIYISNLSSDEALPLDAVINDVKTDFDYARRQKIKVEVFEKLKERYEIIVENE